MTRELVKRGFDEINAKLAANKSKGDFNKAIQILDEREYNEEFEKLLLNGLEPHLAQRQIKSHKQINGME